MKITGILLAGGMSKRMGRDKGILKVGDRFLYEYPLGILESICDEILISTCKGFKLPVAHTMVCDEVAGIGPIGGIYTCIKRSSNDLNIILSYDLPLVNEGLLNYLIMESKAHDIVLPGLREDRPEPLCGVYRKSVTAVLEELIDQRRYAVRYALPMVRSKTILINDQMSFYRPDLFLNINNKSDLDNLPAGYGDEN